jgi:hypothetical protein
LASNEYLYVYDLTIGTLQTTHTFSGTSSGSGTTKINCLYLTGNYVFVGGDFTTIVGNAQSQYGITRFYRVNPWSVDVMFDNSNPTVCSGINGYINSICIDPLNSDTIYCGGNFTSFNGSLFVSVSHVMRVQGITSSGGGLQTYNDQAANVAVNQEVFALCESGGYVFVGGAFTSVNIYSSPLSYNYFAHYTSGTGWGTCDANNFNNYVYSCSSSLNGNVLVGGLFTQTTPSYVCYIDQTTPSNPYIAVVGIAPSSITGLNCVSYFNGVEAIVDNTTNVWTASTHNVWVDKTVSLSGGSPTGIVYYSGSVKVSYSNHGYLREPTAVPQNCVWTLPSGSGFFKYNGGQYTSYQITIPDQAFQFIGDGLTNWRPIGYNAYGSFS